MLIVDKYKSNISENKQKNKKNYTICSKKADKSAISCRMTEFFRNFVRIKKTFTQRIIYAQYTHSYQEPAYH